MERIKQILIDNVSYITVAKLNDLLERKDNLNPQESFILGVNVWRTVERAVKNYHYTLDDVDMLYDFINGMAKEKPAVIKNALNQTEKEFITENHRLTKYP